MSLDRSGPKTRKNIQKMASISRERGEKLRPHVNTHKIAKIARERLARALGITVAKVSQAEIMAESGIRGIFVAYPR